MRALKPHCASTTLRYDVTVEIGERNNRVVKRGVYVSTSFWHVLFLTFSSSLSLSHSSAISSSNFSGLVALDPLLTSYCLSLPTFSSRISFCSLSSYWEMLSMA